MASTIEGRVSYRQVGTRGNGRIRKGSPQKVVAKDSSRVPRSVSSIPSKFETTLHVGTRESNAFGARTHRFVEPDNERPGPGAYHKKVSMEKDSKTCGSVSKLGMGTGFVSKVKRFDNTRAIEDSLRPGPGSYDFRKAYTKKDHNRASNTSNFMPPRRFRDEPVGVPANLNPGPGDYEAKDRSQQAYHRNNRAMSSNFVSSSKRGDYKVSTAPAPGQYNIKSGMDVKPLKDKMGNQMPSSAFRSASERNKALFWSPEVPGPGAYESQSAAKCATTDIVQESMPSSMFSNTVQDRFGTPYVPRTAKLEMPGPGWYEKEAERPKAMVSTSSFLSSVQRDGERTKVQTAPGPAFYKPESGIQKSYLLNATRKWI